MSRNNAFGKWTPRRRWNRAPRAPMTEMMHGSFLSRVGPRLARRYTDGGPADKNRSRKRRAAKRQRQARRGQR